MVEKKPPEDSNLIAKDKDKISFKHVKIVHLKAIHKRIQSFVRMLDFIITDTLRSMVLTAVNVFQAQLSASFQFDNQPDLLELYRWKCNKSKKFKSLIDAESTTKPMFYVSLVLNPGMFIYYSSV